MAAMMPGGMMSMPSPAMTMSNSTTGMSMMSHMTFFWGKNAEILFSGWPGSNTGMYVLALIVVFVLAVLAEGLSHCRLIKSGTNNVVAGLLQTLMHTIRMGFVYLVMLALMSFNGGVFIVAVAGHALGFLLFGSTVFRGDPLVIPMSPQKPSDLPPMRC
ncbi:copper transporter 6-like [Macadamia integrifolia]|uniref:copper transporter 6-like n=1 Tax=Macadamia integrifolia TaxID=60698 RepID=UPI001C4EE290|nr:copper transporter 6-like [Macadamia integrifolia]